MTTEEVLALAGVHVDDTIEFTEGGSEWINQALTSLGKDAYKKGSTTFTVADTSWQDLPADCLLIDEVKDSDGYRYEDYDAEAGQIRFADADTYAVTYRKLPATVTAVAQVLDVHAAFKPALALFVASKFRANEADTDSEELADANRLMNEFQFEAAKVAKMLRRQARRSGTITVQRSAGDD